jgi:hypothetical protein
MKHLPRPNFAARAAFESCIKSMHSSPLKARLNQVINNIEAAETEYLQRATQTALFKIATATDVGGCVTGDEMERVYAGTFVKSVRTRHIYDAIKKLPQNDICPLCSQRTVFTLDHYLAQTRHPALVVAPANLVPACGECNKMKLNAQPTSAADQTFHPYFDNFDDSRWLYATVGETAPASTLFRVAAPESWPSLKKDRANRHFATFGLGALYASHAAVELTNIRHYLTGLSRAGSPQTIKNFLSEIADSAFRSHKNSWQTASYYAFSESNWFCSGGFAQV